MALLCDVIFEFVRRNIFESAIRVTDYSELPPVSYI